MNPRQLEDIFKSRTALQIVMLYAILGTLWILFSDWAIFFLVDDFETQVLFQNYKGGAFVLVTSLLLWFLINKAINRIRGANEELEEKSALLEATFASMEDAVFVIGPEDRAVISANQAVERVFGYSTEEVIGENTAFLHENEEAYREFGRISEAVLGRSETFHREWTMRRKDGAVFPVEVTVSAINPEWGWGRGVVSVVRDISQRRIAEQELRRLNKILRTVSLCNEALVRATSEEQLLKTILHQLLTSGDYAGGWITVLPQGDESVRNNFDRREVAEYFHRMEAARCQILDDVRRICDEATPYEFHLDDSCHHCSRCSACKEMMEQFHIRSAYMLPLLARERHLGCFLLFSSAGGFYPDEVSLLKELADDLAYGIQALRTEKAHRQAEEVLRLRNRAIEASVNGIMISENRLPELPVVYVNRAFEEITGYGRKEVLGRNAQLLVGRDHEQKEQADIRAALWAGRPATALVRNYRQDGSLFWNDLSVSPVRDTEGNVSHFISVIHDVTERMQYEEELTRNSNYDELTGLANRNLLDDRLKQAIAQAQGSGQAMAVLLIDLDRFQIINDSLGHSLGNQMLVQVSQRLKNCVRSQDTLARLSADEFVILYPGVTDRDRLTQLAGSIREQLAPAFTVGERKLEISASIGISLCPDDGEHSETLLRNADLAMYQAKEQGRDTSVFFTPDLDIYIVETMDLEADMRRALERGEFLLHFQPKVDVSDGRIVGSEALVRWQHPDRGIVSPGAFIPLAEEIGLIERLGAWVLGEACRLNKSFQEQGLRPISVAVNISARQFRDERLAEMVSRTLEKYRLEPRWLELELTESMIMHHPEEANRVMQQLKGSGINLSLDDFGTGYSSLNYLRRFPVDNLKIDRSFIEEITLSTGAASVADSIIDIAHNLGIEAIAEGVETEEQLDFLRRCNCDLYQGFLFARPLPAEEFAEMLRRTAEESG